MAVRIAQPRSPKVPEIRKGDTVAVMLANTPPMLEANYGVPMLGAVLNLAAVARHLEVIKRLNRGESVMTGPSLIAITVASIKTARRNRAPNSALRTPQSAFL